MDNVDKTLSTDEIRQIIRDEMRQISASFVTKDEINKIVQSEVNAAVNPAIQELQAQLQTGMAGLIDRFAKLETLIATLGEQTRNLNEWVQSMNIEQKRIDDEQDEIKRGQSRIESRQVEQTAKLESQERAIFGDPTRPGTKSIVDHISDSFEQWGNRIGHQLETMQSDVQAVAIQVDQTNTKVNTIETVVEENRQFRQRRQQIERAFVQVLPKAGKRLWEGMTNDWVVKWATRIGLGGGLGILAALLERLQ